MKDYNDYNDYVKRDDVFDAAYCSVTIDEFIEEIDRIPAADVVPVVRCKDCKYAVLTYDGDCKYCRYWAERHEGYSTKLYLPPDFYCAAGERRE